MQQTTYFNYSRSLELSVWRLWGIVENVYIVVGYFYGNIYSVQILERSSTWQGIGPLYGICTRRVPLPTACHMRACLLYRQMRCSSCQREDWVVDLSQLFKRIITRKRLRSIYPDRHTHCCGMSRGLSSVNGPENIPHKLIVIIVVPDWNSHTYILNTHILQMYVFPSESPPDTFQNWIEGLAVDFPAVTIDAMLSSFWNGIKLLQCQLKSF